MKEYKLSAAQARAVLVLNGERNRIMAEFDESMTEMIRAFSGISVGNLQQRGPDIYVVAQGEEESENL